MNPISLTTILIFSSISAFAGLLLLRIGIRGKQVSSNPHCRKCKFDLHGLNLDEPLQCPECGVDLKANPKAILPARFRARKLVILLSVLFLMISATGFAWPKVSQLPSLQSQNIYDYFPESLLVKLATAGDDEALQTLHDQLIPGMVSSDAITKLIDYGFIHKAETSKPWDERWGDVLIYAFLSDQMTHEQTIKYVEGAIEFEVQIHSEIGRQQEDVAAYIEHRIPSRGTSSTNFRYQWSRAIKPGTFGNDIATPYQLIVEKNIPRAPGAVPEAAGSGISGYFDPDRPGWWIPYTQNSGSIGSTIDVPLELESFECVFVSEIYVYKDGEPFHSWQSRISTQVVRVDEPQYIKMITDPQTVEDIAASITCTPFQIPTKLEEALKHQEIREGVPSQLNLRTSVSSPHGLLGEIWIRHGDEQLKFAKLTANIKERSGYGLTGPYDFRDQSSWLRFYIDNQAFWDRVIQVGAVDVIYRPNESLAADDPRLESMVGSPIIFRDVLIITLIPKLKEYRDGPGGPMIKRWGMHPINEMESGRNYTASEMEQFKRPEPVTGEPLIE